MTTILKEASNLAGSSLEERLRMVRLSENYSQYGVYELLARISGNQVIFTKLDDTENAYDEDGDPVRPANKNYNLTAAEADAFVESWLQYKADRAAALQAEVERKAGVLAEAHRLAGELGLEITENKPDYDGDIRYTLTHATRYINRSYAHGPDSLLEIVKEFQTAIEEEHKTIKEARVVADQITALCGDAIRITSKNPADGRYALKTEGQFSHFNINAVHAGTILDRLQTILRDLERDTKAQQQESALS